MTTITTADTSNFKFYLSDDCRIYAINIGKTWGETVAYEYKIKEQTIIKIAEKQDVIPYYHEAENFPSNNDLKTVWKKISLDVAMQYPVFKENLLFISDL